MTGLPVRRSVLLAQGLLSSRRIKQFTYNFIYCCPGGVNINFNRIFQFIDSSMINLIYPWISRVDVSSRKDAAGEFCCAGFTFQ